MSNVILDIDNLPSNFIIKDSGKRQEFTTGALRDTEDNKPRYDLLSPLALRRVALHMKKGLDKYGEHNWVAGIPISRCYGSLMRHVMAFGEGENSEDHLSAIIFNAMAILHYQESGRKDLDDMFNWRTGKKNG